MISLNPVAPLLVNDTTIKDNNRYRFILCSKLLQYDNILISHNDISKHGNNFKLTSYFYCVKYSDYIYKFLKKKFGNDIALLIIKNYLFCSNSANSSSVELIIKNKLNFNSNIYKQLDMSYKGVFSLNVDTNYLSCLGFFIILVYPPQKKNEKVR